MVGKQDKQHEDKYHETLDLQPQQTKLLPKKDNPLVTQSQNSLLDPNSFHETCITLRDTLNSLSVQELDLHRLFSFNNVLLESLLTYHNKWKTHWRAYIPDFLYMTEYNIRLGELMTHYWIFKTQRNKLLDYVNYLTAALQRSLTPKEMANETLAPLSISFFRFILLFISVSPLQHLNYQPVSLEPLLQLLYRLLSLLFTNSSATTGTRAKEQWTVNAELFIKF